MPISVNCPNCSTRVSADDSAAGTTIRCPDCRSAVSVPAPAVPCASAAPGLRAVPVWPLVVGCGAGLVLIAGLGVVVVGWLLFRGGPKEEPQEEPKTRADAWVEQWTVRVEAGLASRAECVCFSPDGKTLATAGRDGTVLFWDVATGRLKRTIEFGRENLPIAVAFSPDGTTLAVGGHSDSVVTLVDPATGNTRKKLREPDPEPRFGHTSARALAYTRDGTTLAAAGDEDTVRIWDPTAGTLRHAYSQVFRRSNCLAFGRGDRILAAGSLRIEEYGVTLWDLTTGKEIAHIPAKKTPEAIAFSPDGTVLAFAHKNQTTIWDVDAKKELGAVPGSVSGEFRAVTCLAFTHSGRTLIAGGGQFCEEGVLQFIDVNTRTVRETMRCTHQILCIAVSPDGRALAVGTHQGPNGVSIKDGPGKLMLLTADTGPVP